MLQYRPEMATYVQYRHLCSNHFSQLLIEQIAIEISTDEATYCPGLVVLEIGKLIPQHTVDKQTV